MWWRTGQTAESKVARFYGIQVQDRYKKQHDGYRHPEQHRILNGLYECAFAVPTL